MDRQVYSGQQQSLVPTKPDAEPLLALSCAMPIDNQIEPPPSFMAMYVTPGHSRPNAPQDVVLARYELCEDMACMLAGQAQSIADKENLSEQEVLLRCRLGLSADQSAAPGMLTDKELAWVMRRLAELLEWTPLAAEAD